MVEDIKTKEISIINFKARIVKLLNIFIFPTFKYLQVFMQGISNVGLFVTSLVFIAAKENKVHDLVIKKRTLISCCILRFIQNTTFCKITKKW